jgi:hypothetical protein
VEALTDFHLERSTTARDNLPLMAADLPRSAVESQPFQFDGVEGDPILPAFAKWRIPQNRNPTKFNVGYIL